MNLLRKRIGQYLSILFVLLPACVTLERSYPDKHFFAIEVNSDWQPASRPVKAVVEIADISVSRRYEGQNFVYRLSDTSYESDFYNQFLIAPGALITEEVRKALAQSRIFEHVISSSTDLPATYRLQGVVNSLYGDFSNSAAAQAVIAMEFFLNKKTPAGEEIVLAERYVKSAPLGSRSPDALVKGWDKALEDILRSLIANLNAANLDPNATPTTPAAAGTSMSGAAGNR
jgi:cholesterol transport system auxiliary component